MMLGVQRDITGAVVDEVTKADYVRVRTGVIEDARFKRKEALADLAKKAVADAKK